MQILRIKGRNRIPDPIMKLATLGYQLADGLPYTEHYKGKDKAAFMPKLLNTGTMLGWRSSWLPKIIFHESSMNPKSRNALSSATGLINFIPSTARQLGTTIDDLMDMSGTDQLNYVLKYYQDLQNKHGVAKSLADAYMLTFYPKAVGKDPDFVLGGAGTNEAAEIAAQNPEIAGNKGYVTVGDIESMVKHF